MSRRRKDRGGKKPGPPPPAKPRPRSWLWVGTDDPAKRILPHEATFAFERDPAGGGGATIDLFVERGGKEFTGLTVQALHVRGAASVRDLVGQDVIDPPPVLMGIAPLGAPKLGGCAGGMKVGNPLRKLGVGLDPDIPPIPDESPEMDVGGSEDDIEAEESAPDDDPTLGDWETYRRRRAEEAKLSPPEEDPELDERAEAEAEAAAVSERVLIAPGQAYEVEAIRIHVRALEGETAELDLEGRCAEIGADGEVARSGVPFGGKVFARVEEI